MKRKKQCALKNVTLAISITDRRGLQIKTGVQQDIKRFSFVSVFRAKLLRNMEPVKLPTVLIIMPGTYVLLVLDICMAGAIISHVLWVNHKEFWVRNNKNKKKTAQIICEWVAPLFPIPLATSTKFY